MSLRFRFINFLKNSNFCNCKSLRPLTLNVDDFSDESICFSFTFNPYLCLSSSASALLLTHLFV